jgi:hypothetical protein
LTQIVRLISSLEVARRDSKTLVETILLICCRASELTANFRFKLRGDIHERDWDAVVFLGRLVLDSNLKLVAQECLDDIMLELGNFSQQLEAILAQWDQKMLTKTNTAIIPTHMPKLRLLAEVFFDHSMLKHLVHSIRVLECNFDGTNRCHWFAVLRVLEILGECAKKFSISLKAASPKVPWVTKDKNLEGGTLGDLRNILEHATRDQRALLHALCFASDHRLADIRTELIIFGRQLALILMSYETVIASAANTLHSVPTLFQMSAIAADAGLPATLRLHAELSKARKLPLTESDKTNLEYQLYTSKQAELQRCLEKASKLTDVAPLLQTFDLSIMPEDQLRTMINEKADRSAFLPSMPLNTKTRRTILARTLSEDQKQMRKILNGQEVASVEVVMTLLLRIGLTEEDADSFMAQAQTALNLKKPAHVQQIIGEVNHLIAIVQDALERKDISTYTELFNRDSLYYLAIQYILQPIAMIYKDAKDSNSADFASERFESISRRRLQLLLFFRDKVAHNPEDVSDVWLAFFFRDLAALAKPDLKQRQRDMTRSELDGCKELLAPQPKLPQIIGVDVLKERAVEIIALAITHGFKDNVRAFGSIFGCEAGVQGALNLMVEFEGDDRGSPLRVVEFEWMVGKLFDAHVMVLNQRLPRGSDSLQNDVASCIGTTLTEQQFEHLLESSKTLSQFLREQQFRTDFESGQVLEFTLPKGIRVCKHDDQFTADHASRAISTAYIVPMDMERDRCKIETTRRDHELQHATTQTVLTFKIEQFEQQLRRQLAAFPSDKRDSLLSVVVIDKRLDTIIDTFFREQKEEIQKAFVRSNDTNNFHLDLFNFRAHIRAGHAGDITCKDTKRKVFQLLRSREQAFRNFSSRYTGTFSQLLNTARQHIATIIATAQQQRSTKRQCGKRFEQIWGKLQRDLLSRTKSNIERPENIRRFLLYVAFEWAATKLPGNIADPVSAAISHIDVRLGIKRCLSYDFFREIGQQFHVLQRPFSTDVDETVIGGELNDESLSVLEAYRDYKHVLLYFDELTSPDTVERISRGDYSGVRSDFTKRYRDPEDYVHVIRPMIGDFLSGLHDTAPGSSSSVLLPGRSAVSAEMRYRDPMYAEIMNRAGTAQQDKVAVFSDRIKFETMDAVNQLNFYVEGNGRRPNLPAMRWMNDVSNKWTIETIEHLPENGFYSRYQLRNMVGKVMIVPELQDLSGVMGLYDLDESRRASYPGGSARFLQHDNDLQEYLQFESRDEKIGWINERLRVLLSVLRERNLYSQRADLDMGSQHVLFAGYIERLTERIQVLSQARSVYYQQLLGLPYVNSSMERAMKLLLNNHIELEEQEWSSLLSRIFQYLAGCNLDNLDTVSQCWMERADSGVVLHLTREALPGEFFPFRQPVHCSQQPAETSTGVHIPASEQPLVDSLRPRRETQHWDQKHD